MNANHPELCPFRWIKKNILLYFNTNIRDNNADYSGLSCRTVCLFDHWYHHLIVNVRWIVFIVLRHYLAYANKHLMS